MTMQKTAADYALEAKAELERKKELEARIARDNQQAEERLQVRLQQMVAQTLNGFKKLGFKVVRNTLQKNKQEIARVTVEWQHWTFQCSDDSPVKDVSGYQIVWHVHGRWGGVTRDVEQFVKDFGQAMAGWL